MHVLLACSSAEGRGLGSETEESGTNEGLLREMDLLQVEEQPFVCGDGTE